jgi:excinuclease ABC subunit C
MLNAGHELIYVGKAKCLRSRLLSYFRRKSRDPKAGRILGHVRTIIWEYAASEFAALLRELELIRRWRPRFNVQGQPGRRRPTYICLGPRPVPYLFLARFPPRDVLACFGPIPSTWRAREAVRRLNDHFQLRDCPQAQQMVFAEQRELFPIARSAGCLRYEIGTCLGPCLGVCSRRNYLARAQAAQAFLSGKDTNIMGEVGHEMAAASAVLAFEKAAALRDRLEILRWLVEKLGRLQVARDQQSFIYPVRGHDGDELWYLIHGGRVLAAIPAPANESESKSAEKAIQKAFSKKPFEATAMQADEMDVVLLVAGWFRRHPDEKERILSPGEALFNRVPHFHS